VVASSPVAVRRRRLWTTQQADARRWLPVYVLSQLRALTLQPARSRHADSPERVPGSACSHRTARMPLSSAATSASDVLLRIASTASVPSHRLLDSVSLTQYYHSSARADRLKRRTKTHKDIFADNFLVT
jgi:hypothetical protein